MILGHAGTLTCNDMAVVRLWIGGSDHHALQDLCHSPRPAADPLNLSTALLQLLTAGVSLNSSANLESSPEMSGAIHNLHYQRRCKNYLYWQIVWKIVWVGGEMRLVGCFCSSFGFFKVGAGLLHAQCAVNPFFGSNRECHC